MTLPKDIRNSLIYAAQSFATGVFTLLLYPVITEQLAPEVFGVYVLAMVYAVILLGIANLGCTAGYERNFFLVEGSKKKSGYLLGSVQLFVAILFTTTVILGCFFSNFIATLMFDNESFSKLWMLVLIATSLSMLSQYYLTYLKNKGYAGVYFIFTALQVFINFLVALVLLKTTEYGVYSLAYALLCSNAIMFILLFIHQLSNLPIGIKRRFLVDVLKISFPLTPRVIFGFLNTEFDKIMLSFLASMGNVGIYAVAQRIALSIFSFMTALDRAFKPNVYRMLFDKEQRKEIGKYLVPYLYISILPALLLVLFSNEVIDILVSDSYSESASILIVLCIYYSIMFFGNIIGTQLIFSKQTWLTSKLTLWGVLLNVLLNVPMIYLWGGLGAALATTLASLLMTLISYYYAQKFVTILWGYNSIKIYILLLLSVLYALGIEFHIISIDYTMQLIGKLSILLLFVAMGWRIGVLSKDNIRHMRAIIFSRFIFSNKN